MKIALVSPPFLLTPPRGYGGLEQVVFDLGVALVGMGHGVTLVAPKGSNIPGAKLIETVEAPERTDVDWPGLETEAGKHYMDRLGDFDIVHDHSWFGLPYLAKKIKKDMVIMHTHHGHLDWNPAAVPADIKPLNLIGISKFMSDNQIKQGFGSRYCYNGVDMGKYEYSDKPREERLLYVGRISSFKQPDVAIEVAKKAGIPIDIVGGSFVDNQQYLDDIRMLCAESKGNATLRLDASHEEKIRLMQKAKALLVPSHMGEPFGLISVEAMACGTPVIALPDGAIPEVVGDAGYICNTVDEMVKICKYDKLKSPKNCRERAELFSRENMAKNYLKLYEEAIRGPGW
jgi:glycosyltransferase involved in cell wall biosynthesis